MKRKIFYGTMCVVVAVSTFNIVYSSFLEKKYLSNQIVNFDYALASDESSKKDEKNETVTQVCDDGTTCPCVVCEKGNTDCSPTCPCCPEKWQRLQRNFKK